MKLRTADRSRIYSPVYIHLWWELDGRASETRPVRISFVSDLLISCFRNQVPLQRGDSANKERGGRHLPTNHKLRGPELAAAAAACDSAAESGQQQARDTLYVPILFVLLRLVPMRARVRIFARKFTAKFAAAPQRKHLSGLLYVNEKLPLPTISL